MPKIYLNKNLDNQLNSDNRNALNENFKRTEIGVNDLYDEVETLKKVDVANINGHRYSNMNERLAVIEHIIQDELGYDLPGKEVIL